MFTHTLYLSISTQSRYLFTHKRPLYLSTVYTHSTNLSLSLSLSLSLYTRLLLLHSTYYLYLSAHTPTLCTHYLSLSHYLSIYLHILLLSITAHTPSLYLSTRSLSLSVHTHTHCLSVFLQHFTFFNLALEYFFFLFTMLIILILVEDWMPLA